MIQYESGTCEYCGRRTNVHYNQLLMYNICEECELAYYNPGDYKQE